MTEKPTILAIDSSSGACSVAVWKNGEISAYCEELSATQQAKRLINMVEDVLAKSATPYSDLSMVTCTVGPGSFTGIRIGLASARGIGFAANIPVLGFNSLEVLALGLKKQGVTAPIVTVLNAGKGEFIHQTFTDNLENATAPTLSPTNPKPDASATFPRADLLAELAAIYPGHAVEPVPFYVRPPDAKLPEKNNAATA